MTLKEAVATGLPFRHKCWDCYRHEANGSIEVIHAISDDWEVQQPEKKKKTVKVWQWEKCTKKQMDGFWLFLICGAKKD